LKKIFELIKVEKIPWKTAYIVLYSQVSLPVPATAWLLSGALLMAFSELGRTLQKNSRNCCGRLWRPGLEAGCKLWHLLGFLKLESNRWFEVTQTQGTVSKTSLTIAFYHLHCSRWSCKHSGSWRCQWGVIWKYQQHSAWGYGPFLKDVWTIGAKAPDRWPPLYLHWLTARAIQVVEHPPYSPDLSPTDFIYFPKIKENLAGLHLTPDTFRSTWERVSRTIAKYNFAAAFWGWLETCQKFVGIEGSHAKKSWKNKVPILKNKNFIHILRFVFDFTSYLKWAYG